MSGWQPTRSQPAGRASHWIEHPSSTERVDGFLRRVGGVKSGYAGHVPEKHILNGASHFGTTRGWAAQRGHSRSKLNYYGNDAPPSEPLAERAACSLPGYGGHRPGDHEAFGSSFWSPAKGSTEEPPASSRGCESAKSTPRGSQSARSAAPMSDRSTSRWTLSSSAFGSRLEEPGAEPAPSKARGRWIKPPEVRDPDACALKPKHVKQITSTQSGPASTWVPPAGLYLENSKSGHNLNMWALKEGKKGGDVLNIAPRYTPRRWAAPPAVRDPEASGLQMKNVKMLTANLRGPKESWFPPAGLYAENSSKGLNYDMWAIRDGTHGVQKDAKPWIEPPEVRDPDACALKPKHVKQITRNLRGSAESWKPPAGLYIENSKGGLNINMWELRRSKTVPDLAAKADPSPWVTPHAAGLPTSAASGPQGAARDSALEA